MPPDVAGGLGPLLRAWAWLAEHPRAYRPAAAIAAATLGRLGRAAREAYRSCRSPSGGRATATCRRRRDGRFRISTPGKSARWRMSREQVLGRIRAALDHDGSRSARTARTADRLARPPEHPLPARARRPASELVQQFVAMQNGLGVDLIEVGSARRYSAGHCRLSVGARTAFPAAPRKRPIPRSAAVADESRSLS